MNIREKFLKFFEKNYHVIYKSSPVIPHDDNSILFTNSGMVQFKKNFLGLQKISDANVTTCQKCIRAGGKHNDFENVGYTNRHHTFFEMLGNFSFGEKHGGYFKKNAIELAWKFLTNELSLDKEKLWITVHTNDDEAWSIWKNLTSFPDERIVRIESNFWSMGDTGPCGPCSEIFYDKGEQYEGFPPGQGDEKDRYLEIWNLVFMSFDRDSDGNLSELEEKCIDTGMGLERIVSVIEDQESGYETTIFSKIMCKIESVTDKKYLNYKANFRIIADHLRSSVFLLAEGITPSNEDKGYVLRKILRRAFANVYKLSYDQCLLDVLYEVLVEDIGGIYEEISINKELILFHIQNEYKKFSEILTNSKKMIIDMFDSKFSEKDASFLYETHGVPFDITKEIVEKEYGIYLSQEKFDIAYSEHKEKAKGTWKEQNTNSIQNIVEKFLNSAVSEKIQDTHFVGYEEYSANAILLKIHYENNRLFMIFDKTPFYATGGGQINDTGYITVNNKSIFVEFVEKKQGIFVHISSELTADSGIEEKCNMELKIDLKRRNAIAANHSATHLLNHALRKVLGNHVVQKGSLINEHKLRFDFAQDGQISTDQLYSIEKIVNSHIRANYERVRVIDAPENAIKKGAVGTFEDKYMSEVFVVSFGDVTEICGGTHVKRTGDIGFFKIIHQSSISSGVRRLEAVTGLSAEKYIAEKCSILDKACSILNVKDHALIDKILTNMQKSSNKSLAVDVNFDIVQIGKSIHLCYANLQNVDVSVVKNVFVNKKNTSKTSVFIGILNGNTILVGLTKDLTENGLSATELLKCIVTKGGGGKDLAQGQCSGDLQYDDIKNKVTAFIK